MTDPAQAVLARFELAVTFCRLCGSRTVCQRGLCSYCWEIRMWSDINRAFCALIHRYRSVQFGEER